MAHPVEIRVDDTPVQAVLGTVVQRLADKTPAMRAIAGVLLQETGRNFAAQGRPGWAALSATTIARRSKTGHWPGQILRVSGRLASSITPEHSAVMAAIGTNVKYAATQQFGAAQGQFGRDGRNHPLPWGNIPARPFLPITADHALQPAAVTAVLAAIWEVLGEA